MLVYSKLIKKIKRTLPKNIREKLPHKIEAVPVSPAKSKQLNRLYLNKNKFAKVLSFRYGSDYGEILICLPLIKKNAKKEGNPQSFQMTWMILHGMLHLAGRHHEWSKVKAEEFEKLEERILKIII